MFAAVVLMIFILSGCSGSPGVLNGKAVLIEKLAGAGAIIDSEKLDGKAVQSMKIKTYQMSFRAKVRCDHDAESLVKLPSEPFEIEAIRSRLNGWQYLTEFSVQEALDRAALAELFPEIGDEITVTGLINFTKNDLGWVGKILE